MSRKRRLIDILRSRYPDTEGERLLARILCGEVLCAGGRIKDPKALVAEDAEISFQEKSFVSRGGEKLDKALDLWALDVRGKVMLDAGASTGGFTDCLLERGAALVHAVDVGYNQLHQRLRKDPRVLVRERTNVMDLDSLDPAPDAAVCDLSFRSLRNAAARILGLTAGKWLVALVKPQFEWRNPPEAFDGVVRSEEDLMTILLEVAKDLREEGVGLKAAAESPIRGASGNREFLFLLVPGPDLGPEETDSLLRSLVRRS